MSSMHPLMGTTSRLWRTGPQQARVPGPAGRKGGALCSMHPAIPGGNHFINNGVTEPPAYPAGQGYAYRAIPFVMRELYVPIAPTG